MFSNSAELYDEIYSSFKDYKDESEKVRHVIKEKAPHAKRILDVACGTGEHAKYLSNEYHVDGIDLDENLLKLAQAKNPNGQFSAADMSKFKLEDRYDVVMCLFSSIGYILTTDGVRKTLGCFKNALSDNGIILVEPWLEPAQWNPGKPHMVTIDKEGFKVCRMNTTGQEGKVSTVQFHYLVGKPDGVLHFTEDHRLGLYTKDEMLGAFESEGLSVQYDPEGLFGRGLYIARPYTQ